MNNIKGKKIVLGVTGGIAAYKSCELVRKLVKEGADVQVIMTENAMEFITPLTLQTLSGNRVATKTFDLAWESEIGHITLADSAEVIVVAPATASFIGKVAAGIADTLLTTVILATRSPVIICPAMNVNMYNNPAVQENLEKLNSRGFYIIEPEEGDLACGWEGKGRLPHIDDICDEVQRVLTPQDLCGEKILITAGATREYIDSVRFISNPSTGKMGYSLAKAAWTRGADVVLISAKCGIKAPSGIKVIDIISSADMHTAVMEHVDWATIVVKAAAVGDYTPVDKFNGKLKKDSSARSLKLIRTKDILQEVGQNKKGKFIIGFAAETENLIDNAKDKLFRKNADIIVANDVLIEGAGFEDDTNVASLVFGHGEIEELPLMTKLELAHKVFDKVVVLKNSNVR